MHRDIRPESVLVFSTQEDDEGVLSFADLGVQFKLAHLHEARYLREDEQTDERTGDVEYCAPERLYSEPYNYKADLWALGCLYYRLMVGFVPFQASAVKPMDVVTKLSEQFQKGFYFIPRSLNLPPTVLTNLQNLL